MLPLLLLQLYYKSVWLIAVALPLWSSGRPPELTKTFVIGVVGDLIVIPWTYPILLGVAIMFWLLSRGIKVEPSAAPASLEGSAAV